jgi:hypothetical protein
MAPAGGIKRRNPNKAVDAAFAFQIAVRVVALDLDGGGLDAGFFPSR